MMYKIRITAGKHRGRQIQWSGPAVRPTPSIMRERLFNWLQFEIHQSRCIDLFAGSGILGIEALSRGAKHCQFIDNQQAHINDIQKNLSILFAEDQYTLSKQTLPNFIPESSADIIFCDPPYNFNAHKQLIDWLHQHFSGARLYYEASHTPAFPETWRLLKSAKQGKCTGHLLEIASC